jgi:hypothetical protein
MGILVVQLDLLLVAIDAGVFTQVPRGVGASLIHGRAAKEAVLAECRG